MSQKIISLFFSRGRGHGHAIPDMEIAKVLANASSEIENYFASYATGASTFRANGVKVRDMNLPEDNPYFPTLFASYAMIQDVRPDIVIAHEELASIVAAKLLGVPSIYISAWLPQLGSPLSGSLPYADSVVLLENPGLFPLSDAVSPKIRYCGPLVREMKSGRNDKKHAREILEVPIGALVVTIASGGWASEEKAPTAKIILDAFERLNHANKFLVWLTGRDHESIALMTSTRTDVRLIQHTKDMDVLLAASDIVITKANRGTVMEAASIGIPSISLSFGLNPVDDLLVGRLHSNVLLNARATSGSILCHYIERVLDDSFARFPKPLHLNGSVNIITTVIAEEIQRLVPFATEKRDVVKTAESGKFPSFGPTNATFFS